MCIYKTWSMREILSNIPWSTVFSVELPNPRYFQYYKGQFIQIVPIRRVIYSYSWNWLKSLFFIWTTWVWYEIWLIRYMEIRIHVCRIYQCSIAIDIGEPLSIILAAYKITYTYYLHPAVRQGFIEGPLIPKS